MIVTVVCCQDILGHPNTKAFVTHAGYLSFEEALCHGVPMVATPICYDQFDNAAEIENLGIYYLCTYQKYLEISIFLYAGIGKSVKFTDISLDNLTEALSEVMKTSALHQTS